MSEKLFDSNGENYSVVEASEQWGVLSKKMKNKLFSKIAWAQI